MRGTIQVRDATPPFTRRQIGGIHKVARRFGIPYDQRWDFVHEAWLKVHGAWMKVPRVEPAMSRYVWRLARNLAIDLWRKLANDLMTGAVVFSSLPEWSRDDDEDPFADAPGTPELVTITVEDRVFARQLAARAAARDPEAAGWMLRATLEDERVSDIAAAAGLPADRLYKRVARLVAKLET